MLHAAFLVVCLVATVAADDFVDVYPSADYEFIFHNTHDLLLTIHGNSCYFTYVADGYQKGILFQHQYSAERYLMKAFSEDSDAHALVAMPSTLSEVRNIFADLLADFHCADKDIYTIALRESDLQAMGGTHTTAEPHTSTDHSPNHATHTPSPTHAPPQGSVTNSGHVTTEPHTSTDHSHSPHHATHTHTHAPHQGSVTHSGHVTHGGGGTHGNGAHGHGR
ncbi:uncharacterized protein [Littorina saxatilis]|uniref:Uncharacterized protein n=1 Tax=Littorina saxatilis TaxID=31220 RepID=A0AAN9GMI9_9CAEN